MKLKPLVPCDCLIPISHTEEQHDWAAKIWNKASDKEKLRAVREGLAD